MEHLAQSIKDTLNIASGYVIGTLIVEGDYVGLLQANDSEIQLQSDRIIEVRTGDDTYERIGYDRILTCETVEGWPAYAGLYARVK